MRKREREQDEESKEVSLCSIYAVLYSPTRTPGARAAPRVSLVLSHQAKLRKSMREFDFTASWAQLAEQSAQYTLPILHRCCKIYILLVNMFPRSWDPRLRSREKSKVLDSSIGRNSSPIPDEPDGSFVPFENRIL